MLLAQSIGRLQGAEQAFQVACRQVASAHPKEVDLVANAHLFAQQAASHLERLQPFIKKYGVAGGGEAETIRAELFKPDGSYGMLRDLSGLALLTSAVQTSWTVLGQAAKALRDKELETTVDACSSESTTQLEWLQTRIKASAPQVLIATQTPPPKQAMSEAAARQNLRHSLMERWGKAGVGIYALLGIVLAAGLAGLIALALHQPLLFPSLGPTAYLAFERPTEANSSVRNALIGHGLALLIALAALQVFGLANHPPALQEGMTIARLIAAVLALAITSAVLVMLDAEHPPAGATSLLVTLGLFKGLQGALVIVAGVLIVVTASFLINRALGVRMPLRPLKD